MAKGAKLKLGEWHWLPPESLQRQRAAGAETVEDLKALLASPSDGEFRTIEGDELVQRFVTNDKGDCEYRVYDGKPEDYQHTVRGSA